MMIKKFSIYTFLLLFLISCSQYQSEYREDAINEHKNIYGFSNLDLDDDEILTTKIMSFKKFLSLIKSGKIIDPPSIIACLIYAKKNKID